MSRGVNASLVMSIPLPSSHSEPVPMSHYPSSEHHVPQPRERRNARESTGLPPVCLLDDDSSVLKATGRLLTSAGFRVQAFSDPHVFLRHVEKERPRVVVIDMMMPLMHGLEVQKRLRQISPDTRVLVLTAKDDKSVMEQALAGGAVGLFLKPLSEDEFLAAIESASQR